MEELDRIEINGHVGIITFDPYPMNPLTDQDGNLGTILYAHSRYDFEGAVDIQDRDSVDQQSSAFHYIQREEEIDPTCVHCGITLEYEGYGTWVSVFNEVVDDNYQDVVSDVCLKAEPVVYLNHSYFEHKPEFTEGIVILPVGMHDHSGISMYVGSGRGWDNGPLGIIYCTYKKAEEICGKEMTEEEITEILTEEVNAWSAYQSGMVYRWAVLDEDEDETHSEGSWTDEAECKKALISELESM